MTTIALFTSNNWKSKIIQFFTKSKISHAALGIEQNGKKYFLHSKSGGVQLSSREDVLSYDQLFAEFEIIPDISDEIPNALKYIGDKYNTLELFGFIFVLIGRKLHIGLHNPFAMHGAEICSEFVVMCDTEDKICEFKGLRPSDIDPNDLYEICKTGKSFNLIK